jgi:hypothetical protein
MVDEDVLDEVTVGRVLGYLVCLVAVVCGLAWLVQGSDFFLYKAFAARQEAARREVFEESKAYNDGMAQELDAMRFEYLKAAPEQRAALASVILHRAAAYDVARLPPDLRDFVAGLRRRGAVQ